MATKLTTRDVRVNYLANIGVGTLITIPAGTVAMFVEGNGGGWAVKDTALVIRLTGNNHDPHYRYVWLPDSAFDPA